MAKKKILIITYYWPPSGGAGVQRWLKFAKYLPEFGYDVHVAVPKNANYPSLDSSLEADVSGHLTVLKIPIWEPYNIYRKFMGFTKDYKINHTFSAGGKSDTWRSKLSLWIKSNLFIPDPRIFWVFNTLPQLNKYIIENSIEVVITTSPPHSIHLIGFLLKKKNPTIKWIADFRDPWTTIYYFDSLPICYISKKINKVLEKKVLKRADRVITVSNSIAEELSLIREKTVDVITNGYDESDFKELEFSFNYNQFNLVYIGTLYKSYNMPTLWESLSEISKNNVDFKNNLKITIAGSIDPLLMDEFKNLNLIENICHIGYVNHDQIAKLMDQANVLLLTTPENNNRGILTGKFFEYLASLKPILCITSKENNLWNLIQETQSGLCADFNDKETIKTNVLKYFNDFINKQQIANKKENILKFSRVKLTNKLSDLISNLCAA